MITPVYDYQNLTGLIVPDATDIKAKIGAEYQDSFSESFDVTSPNTPQGLLINAETEARISVADNNAKLANQINPNFAGGVFLDAIMGLMGSSRIPEANSLVQCTLAGIAGTVIPAGSLAKDTNGNFWELINSVTLPGSGTISGIVFSSVEAGPIVVAVNALNIVVVPNSTGIAWETVTNIASNTFTGFLVQSDAQARQYRINTLYLQGNSLPNAIIAGLYSTNGVGSLSFVENPTGGILVVSGVTMNAHSIYVCVDGGTDIDIASSLTATKSAGCAYTNGASAINVDYLYGVPISGQTIAVLFDRPDVIQIAVQVQVILNQPIQNYADTIQDVILKYINGNISQLIGLGVGQSVSPFEISAAIGIEYPGIYVSDLEIKNISAAGSFVRTEIDIEKWQIAAIQRSDIFVSLGV